MKTLFETIYEGGDFVVDFYHEGEKTLYFKSIETNPNDHNFLFLLLSKEEALNLAQHILKLYSE